jgi:hypothetical protein
MAPKKLLVGLTMACLMLNAAVAEAGYFATIAIDGAFGDWAAVPVVDSDASDNSGGPDIGDTQIANDGQYLYIRNTFLNSLQLSTYIAIDIDQNAATGHNAMGLGLVGSEASWQNDFGFSQSTGVFSNGPLIGLDFFGGGHALLDPFGNFPSRELAISLSNQNNGGVPTFSGATIRLLIYTDSGTGADGLPSGASGDSGLNGDATAVINYTLATRSPVPEPSSMALFATVAVGAWFRRRKR